MEKRPFKFGKSSLAFVIPMSWARKSGLEPESTLYITEDDRGSLVLSTKRIATREVEEEIGERLQHFIWRVIGFHYMRGITKLRLYSKAGFSEKQLEDIQDKVRELYIGFEITHQSRNDILLEDISDIKGMTIDKILSRLHYLLAEEFTKTLQGEREVLASDEELVNRHYLFCVRYLNIVKPDDIYVHLRTAQMMEWISDLLARIAKLDIKKAKIRSMVEGNLRQFELSIKALNGNDQSIEAALKEGEAMLKKMYATKFTDHEHMLFANLTRSIMAIAEAGIAHKKSRSEELLLEP